ncbi:uncharacterized protein (TIGR03083 family) [Mumia flava]|uniref:Uncharacterized protein (TIGR03083 family) n=1 Tax=Mumia flava TaxID=1348852 RepID=A0A2M9AQ70_9ACTN|nr:maleylpyruvate isomerase family mycothiol-dependent enzyme [Mumia flava]PJJ47846.1 uncharacterized protein (TIGR03083 family) [Mumia flava]
MTETTSNPLQLFVDAWAESADRTVALLRELSDTDWGTLTGCPGWRVREVVAHLAAVEAELAGGDGPSDVVITGAEMGSAYVEAGVAQRAEVSTVGLVDELAEAVEARRKALAPAPTEPASPADHSPGGSGWTWEVLLRNRVIDMWVHEQDIRRAVGRPGGYDGAAAQIVTQVFTMAIPFVVGKRVGADPGTTVVLEITGDVARTIAVGVSDDGRARPLDGPPAEPDVTLELDVDTFITLATGRRALRPATLSWTGDQRLAGAVLANLAVTP